MVNMIFNEIECPMCRSRYWYEYDEETTAVICKNKICEFEIEVDPFHIKDFIIGSTDFKIEGE